MVLEPGAADPDGAVVAIIGRLARLALHIGLQAMLVDKDEEAALLVGDNIAETLVDG